MTTQVIRDRMGEILGSPDAVRDRFLIGRSDSEGRFTLVEHLMAPRALAAPVHRHTREDEYSFVREGQVGIMLDDRNIVADVGDLVFKPRGQWHTFWNAGDEPARILELISPAGVEDLFRELDLMQEQPDVDVLITQAARYGCEIDVSRTGELVERLGLVF